MRLGSHWTSLTYCRSEELYRISSKLERGHFPIIMVYRNGKSYAVAFAAVYLFLAAGASVRQGLHL